jgi:hypothetical protein
VMFVAATLLLVVALVGAPLATAGEAVRASGATPKIIVFDNEEFLGDHIHMFGNIRDLGKWGNRTSSLIILSGTWELFGDEDFNGTSIGTLGPGMYELVASCRHRRTPAHGSRCTPAMSCHSVVAADVQPAAAAV